MAMIAKNKGKKIRFLLFFIGGLISIVGWFVDKAPSYPFLMKLIVPECMDVQTALDQLENGKIEVISSDRLAFKTIIKWWHPGTPKEFVDEATCISKGPTAMIDSRNGRSYYMLQLCKDEGKKRVMGYYWPDYDLRNKIQEEIDNSILGLSGIFFFSGLLLSAFVVIWEYLSG